MPGPGEYRPDPTEGITRIEDLPKPKIRCQSRNYRRRPCPRCGHSCLPRPPGPSHPPRPGQSPHRTALRPRRDLLPALLHPLPQVLQRRHDRPGRPRQPLHPTRHRRRRPPGHRGRLAVSHRQLDPLARSPRVRPLRHDPELGRGRGKRRRDGSTPTTSTGHCRTSRATSPPTSCMTARSASSRSSTTAPSSGSPTRSSTTTRPQATSRRSSAASARPWRRAG